MGVFLVIGTMVVTRLASNQPVATTQVLQLKIDHHDVSGDSYRSENGQAAVIWLDGVADISAQEAIQ